MAFHKCVVDDTTGKVFGLWQVDNETTCAFAVGKTVKYIDFGRFDDDDRDNPDSRYTPDDKRKPWAMDVSDAARAVMTAENKWNNGKHKSHEGPYRVINNTPFFNKAYMLPALRRNTYGPGVLGCLGPNHAADPCLMQFVKQYQAPHSRNEMRAVYHLRVVLIRRKDTRQAAIPGGMVEEGEAISATLKRELSEEAFDKATCGGTRSLPPAIEALFSDPERCTTVHKGIVYQDPRNTMNAWMETVVTAIDATGIELAPHLSAGSDASHAFLADIYITLPNTFCVVIDGKPEELYANHMQFVWLAAKHLIKRYDNK